MNEMDKKALETFKAGCTKEAKIALGHLLRNALQPIVAFNTEDRGTDGCRCEFLLEHSSRALRKVVLLVDLLAE